MLSASLLSLRETFETSIVVCIVLAFLQATGRAREQRGVWLGVGLGGLVSIGVALALDMLDANLNAALEPIYEGAMMLTAAGLLGWMLIWMMRTGHRVRANIELRLSQAENHTLSAFLISFTTTLREGTELVIFLKAATFQSGGSVHTLIGVMLGMTVAVAMAFLIFRGMRLIPMRAFFACTTGLLLLFGAGLVSHGIHELMEAGVITVLSTPLWNLHGLLSDRSLIGGLVSSTIGLDDAPSILQMIGYAAYLLLGIGLWGWISRTSAVIKTKKF